MLRVIIQSAAIYYTTESDESEDTLGCFYMIGTLGLN